MRIGNKIVNLEIAYGIYYSKIIYGNKEYTINSSCAHVISPCECILGCVNGQSEVVNSSFGNVFYLGFSTSPIPGLDVDKASNTVEDEFSYSINVAVGVTKRLAIGLDARRIYYNLR